MRQVTTAPATLPSSHDVLTEVLRQGAQQMLARAIEAEVAEWIDQRGHLTNDRGHRQVVRNGYHPERWLHANPGSVWRVDEIRRAERKGR